MQRDAFYVVTGSGKFGISIRVEPRLKGRDDTAFIVIPDCDDEGKAVLFDVLRVPLGELHTLRISERVEPCACLL